MRVYHRMIANARMYSVTPKVAALWRSLLAAVLGKVDAPIDIVDHAPPAPISELWRRPDKAAVFMCGLPWSLATPRPTLVVAPRPSPAAYGGRACYWTDLVYAPKARSSRWSRPLAIAWRSPRPNRSRATPRPYTR